jgi:hypothetical protein
MDSAPDTKRERRLAARTERQRMAEEGRRRAQQRRRLTLAGIVILAVAILAGAGYLLAPMLSNIGKPPIGRSVPDEGRTHVNPGERLTFRENPPASGPHYPSWTRPGVYPDPQDAGNWVHSLEHGYVVILYNCPTDCPDLVAQLRTFYESAPKSAKYGYQKLVITPYKDMPNRITAEAWTKKLELDAFDADQLMNFYRTYVDKGPEDAN